MNATALQPLDSAVLPRGVRSRFVDNGNGLVMHLLEAGFDAGERPCVLLLHGFPELAYSWRKVMPALAAAGYHVVAPDQRGYGRTRGGDASYDGDWRSFRFLNLMRDAMGLLAAIGVRHVHTVVGHDFGSWVAAWCALVRPDIFGKVVLMSAPFSGAPALPLPDAAQRADVHAALAALPRPRKHYQRYYTTREANDDMWHCAQGVHALPARVLPPQERGLGAQPAVSPGLVERRRTGEDAHLLRDGPARDHGADGGARDAGCRTDRRLCLVARARAARVQRASTRAPASRAACSGTAAPPMPNAFANCSCSPAARSMCRRCTSRARAIGASIRIPARSKRCRPAACTRMRAAHLLDGAGHWVQQEQPEAVSRLLMEFMS